MSGFALRKFLAPELLYGVGATDFAGQYAKNEGGGKVFVATDPGVIESGLLEPVLMLLEKDRLDYVVYSDIRPNPTLTMVMEGARIFDEEECELIIALGGGSPMDCAKAIGAVHANGLHASEFFGVDRISLPCPPVICIPTTAGSAADVSQFAIIKDEKTLVKNAIISKSIVPDVSLTDPRNTLTMDRALTAATGLDALTHAIEAYVSRASSAITDLHSLRAVQLVSEFLPKTLGDLSNLDYRSGMTLASMHAGLAFSNASLGVIHALSHSLGGLLDLPHGECNSLLLSYGVKANYSAAPERYARILDALAGERARSHDPLSELLARIADLREEAGIPGRLRELGLEEESIPTLAGTAAKDPCMLTNPLPLDPSDLEALLRDAF